jgi:hypothetical protein
MLIEDVHAAMMADASNQSVALNQEITNPHFDSQIDPDITYK